MIAAWMLYCVLCALGLSLAATLAERALLAGRRQVRHVWVVAMALSLLIPMAAYRYASSPRLVDSTTVAPPAVAPTRLIDPALPISAPSVVPVSAPAPGRNWGIALARIDRPLTVAWLALSLTLALYLVGGVIALAWMRRSWQRRVVLGVPVFVSERTGPALVGVVSPSIVVPEWSLAIEPAQLALMLRHEQEHRAAGDGKLLTLAQLALIVMPWNVALWWQLMRLRVSVELDCDARVLRDANARTYGDLLLEVARPRRGLRLIGATAFVERATQLERRIRVMSRHRDQASRGARVLAISIGVMALTVAWVAPHPSVPARPSVKCCRVSSVDSVQRQRSEASAPATEDRQVPSPRLAPNVAAKEPSDVDAAAQSTALSVSSDAKPPAATVDSRSGTANDTATSTPPHVTQWVELIFRRLFDGITLTRDQEAKALAQLTALALAQTEQDQVTFRAALAVMPKRIALMARRDSALSALLTNDTDRATLAARLTQPAVGGARGRGSSGADTPAGGMGGAGMPAGARSGGPGAAPQQTASLAEDATFRRLLDGIALTREQEATARTVIAKAQQDLFRVTPRPQPVRLAAPEWRFQSAPSIGTPNPETTYIRLVIMQAESESALAALLTTDADREVLHARIAPSMTLRSPEP